jgi:hypothetical protein
MPETLLATDQAAPALPVDPYQSAGSRLGYDLAAASDDPTALDQLWADALTTHGPEAFGHVAAAALRHVIEHVVHPLVDLAERHSHPARQRLTDAADHAHRNLS